MDVPIKVNDNLVLVAGLETARTFRCGLFIKPRIIRKTTPLTGVVLYKCEGDGFTTGWRTYPCHAYHEWEWGTGRRHHVPRRCLIARRLIGGRFDKHPSELNTYVMHQKRLMQVVGYSSFSDELIVRDWSR